MKKKNKICKTKKRPEPKALGRLKIPSSLYIRVSRRNIILPRQNTSTISGLIFDLLESDFRKP